MPTSVSYGPFSPDKAITNIKNCFKKNNFDILEEKEINKGIGYKFSSFDPVSGTSFSLILYFSSGLSSKIVFEDIPKKFPEDIKKIILISLHISER